jgi:hypothetical protein
MRDRKNGLKATRRTYNEQMNKRKVLWRQMDTTPPDFSEYYTKQQQLKAREQALMARQGKADSQAKRKADTRRKIVLGGIWLKYFPELRELDPSDEANFAGVAGALVALANDKNFLAWWAQHTNKGGGG